MSIHFNKLSPAEAERLAWLAEELSEAIQVIGKILRHGYASANPIESHPDFGIHNRTLLAKEIRDVRAAISLMEQQGDVVRLSPKKASLRYMHHQEIILSEPYKAR